MEIPSDQQTTGVFCSSQLCNYRQMDLSGPSIDLKLKERKKEDLICIIESIRDMSVDISCRKRPGAEEDLLYMPVILQLLLALFIPPM